MPEAKPSFAKHYYQRTKYVVEGAIAYAAIASLEAIITASAPIA